MNLTDKHTHSIPEFRVHMIDQFISKQIYNELWKNREFVEEGVVSEGTYSKLWNEIFLAANEVLNE